MASQMLYFMPILTIIIAWTLPAGLPLYWVISTVLGLGQEYYLLRKIYGKNQKIS
jgi:YidC/Oxa1 family membrane protein insertase